MTHYIGDPGYAGGDGMSLAFEYQGDFILGEFPLAPLIQKSTRHRARGLTIEVTAHDWTPLAQHYTAHMSTTGTRPREVASGLAFGLAISDGRGKPLQSWRDLDKLEIRGTATKENPPRFRQIPLGRAK